MNEQFEISLLYDFYGALLNPSQQRVVELYVNDDLSLSEVADILEISRQGVRDALSRATRKLRSYESKLGLLAAYRERRSAVSEITALAHEITVLADSEEIVSLAQRIEKTAAAVTEKEE